MNLMNAVFCHCTPGGFGEASLMAEVMATKRCRRRQKFFATGVTGYLLSELDRMSLG
jgi:hypothetical protein